MADKYRWERANRQDPVRAHPLTSEDREDSIDEVKAANERLRKSGYAGPDLTLGAASDLMERLRGRYSLESVLELEGAEERDLQSWPLLAIDDWEVRPRLSFGTGVKAAKEFCVLLPVATIDEIEAASEELRTCLTNELDTNLNAIRSTRMSYSGKEYLIRCLTDRNTRYVQALERTLRALRSRRKK
jgi:hypothetical protein